MSLRLLSAVLIVMLPIEIFGAERSLVYQLAFPTDNPHRAVFSAATAHIETLTMLPPRSNPVVQGVEPVNIQCLDDGLTSLLAYDQAAHCERIEWSVSFVSTDDHTVDVSEQRNIISSAGWWVLFEWDNIPRVQGVVDVSVCVPRSDSSPPSCRPLPSPNSAPLVMIWGQSTQRFVSHTQPFHLFADPMGAAELTALDIRLLGDQFNYLAKLFPASKSASQPINIAWVGIGQKQGSLGGAAGVGAYVANYPLEGDQFSDLSKQKLFWISGHETFHMLTSFPFPLWVSESLAHYYGYKSMAQFSSLSIHPVTQWAAVRKQLPFSDLGLYEAHKAVTVEGRGQFYGLFYDKGAAYWYELDTNLQEHGDSLDHYLELISKSSSAGGKLGRAFFATIEKVIGSHVLTDLNKEYL